MDDDALDDDTPLGAEEAAAATLLAGSAADETLGERIEAVVEELGGVAHRRAASAVTFLVAGRAFAVLDEDRLEVALDPRVADAALKTPDTAESPRGAGWIAFAPPRLDRFALDRAEAWMRSAHRRASGGR